jgi:hypothetical protein
MRTTRNLTLATAAAFALGLAGFAIAAGETSVPTVTGCLKNGKLDSIAVGDAPLAPCGAGQQVRLSGGDVTSVAAGPGLSGGGDTGAVTLAIDPSKTQSRVIGSCERDPIDASIRAIHADGSVSCNPDDKGADTDVFAGFRDDFTWLPTNTTQTPEPIASLPVPAGRYLATATLDLEGSTTERTYVTCDLRAANDFDETTVGVDGLLASSGVGASRIALQVVHQFAESGHIVIACVSTGGTRAGFLKVVATRASGLANAPLDPASS